MALPPTTANWHWKNKDVTRWGKEWFGRELTTLTVKGDDEGEVSVSEVVYVDGDIELGQRKSKLITIYEVKIQLKWEGTAGDGSEVRGTLTIPEVSHEITVDGLSKYEVIIQRFPSAPSCRPHIFRPMAVHLGHVHEIVAPGRSTTRTGQISAPRRARNQVCGIPIRYD
jgi:activator of HSP90 ATPase